MEFFWRDEIGKKIVGLRGKLWPVINVNCEGKSVQLVNRCKDQNISIPSIINVIEFVFLSPVERIL